MVFPPSVWPVNGDICMWKKAAYMIKDILALSKQHNIVMY